MYYGFKKSSLETKTMSSHTMIDSVNALFTEFLGKQSNGAELEKQWMRPVHQKQLKSKLASASKKKADPNAPKRPKSPFLLFCDVERPQLYKQYPDSKMTEFSSQLGAMWSDLKNDPDRASELKHYQKEAEKDKRRYEAEKARYDAM